jgi:hypothetical protein
MPELLVRQLLQHWVDLAWEFQAHIPDLRLRHPLTHAYDRAELESQILSFPLPALLGLVETFRRTAGNLEADAWARVGGVADFKLVIASSGNGGGGSEGEDPIGGQFVGLALAGLRVIPGISAILPWVARTAVPGRLILNPGWGIRIAKAIRDALTILGVTEGYEAIFEGSKEEADAFMALGGPLDMLDNGPLTGLANLPPGIVVVKTWVAGKVPFYRFSNGWIAVRKLDGIWKLYKPQRPIVLYPGAGNSRRSIMKAATILRAEDKANRKLNRMFAPKPARKALPKPRTIVVESGRGGVQVVE